MTDGMRRERRVSAPLDQLEIAAIEACGRLMVSYP